MIKSPKVYVRDSGVLYADAPTVTRSLRVAREDLKLVRAFVVHPGQRSYPLEEWAEAVALPHLRDRLLELVSPRK